VTGSNKGIGYSIIENVMSQKLDYNIMMTSRDRDLGVKAVETLLDLYPSYKDRIDVGS
jgi:hypothetical protein